MSFLRPETWATLLVSVASVGVAAGTSACNKEKADQKHLTRGGDKPAVVLVGEPEDSAGTTAEVEPNGEFAEAQAVEAGLGLRGVLEGSTDVDRYQFTVAATGLLFANVGGGGEADLTLALHDAEGKVLAKSDRGPAGTGEGLPGFGVEAETTYQLVVTEFVGRKLRKAGGRKGPSAPYTLEWKLAEEAEQGYEVEPNQELEGASEILAGEEHRGYIGWSGDTDLWRMPITGFGEVVAASADDEASSKEAMHLVLSPVPGVATRLALLSATGEVIAERRAGKGEEVALRNFLPVVGVDSYTIRVAGKPSNPEESYILRVDAVEIAPGTEEEPNDSMATATPLGGDDSSLLLARGEVTMGDADVFRLASVAHDRILELQLRGPSQADLDVSVVAESGAIIVAAETEAVGVNEALSMVPVGAGQSIHIRISPKKLAGPAEYELSLSLLQGTAPPILPPPAPEPIDPNTVSPTE